MEHFFPVLPYNVIETRVEVQENGKLQWEDEPIGRVVQCYFECSFLQRTGTQKYIEKLQWEKFVYTPFHILPNFHDVSIAYMGIFSISFI